MISRSAAGAVQAGIRFERIGQVRAIGRMLALVGNQLVLGGERRPLPELVQRLDRTVKPGIPESLAVEPVPDGLMQKRPQLGQLMMFEKITSAKSHRFKPV